MSDEPITVFADYVCPFCYLGRSSLEQYQDSREEPVDVEWHPFDLRANKRTEDGEIDHDVDDGKDEDYFEQARQNVRRLQEQYDVEMTQEIVGDVDSRNAQQASLYVRETHPDEWAAFDDAIYEAVWSDGRDIGDPDVLADLAEDAGIDPDEIRTAIESDEWRERLETAFARAHSVGISGVPTFAYDDRAARGAVPPEQLRRLVEGV